jgi:hypothetical protein
MFTPWKWAKEESRNFAKRQVIRMGYQKQYKTDLVIKSEIYSRRTTTGTTTRLNSKTSKSWSKNFISCAKINVVQSLRLMLLMIERRPTMNSGKIYLRKLLKNTISLLIILLLHSNKQVSSKNYGN